MFVLPGILLLLTVIYIRPQEFIPALAPVPLLYLFVGLSLFGFVVDLRLRRSRLRPIPQLLYIVLFVAWCVLTVSVRAPDGIVGSTIYVGNSVMLALLIGHGVQTFRGFEALTGWLLVLVLFVSAIAVHQGMQPYTCIVIDESSGDGSGTSDGRPCEVPRDCTKGDAEPGAEYGCERTGLLKTSSIGGRVRYRGPLNDPNELSLAAGIGLPFAFAFLQRKRSFARAVLLVVTLAVVGTMTVMSKSRGGQIVFLVVVGIYFVRRSGMKGLLLGALMAVPMLMLGGRSGEEAESSSLERLGCWYEGMSMFRAYPLLGVGQGHFTEHHVQTAHNSYVLAPAELGFPGFMVWTAILYLCLKIPVQALRRYGPERGPQAEAARVWALALLASLAGLYVGIFFLSFCYHVVLWSYIGLAAAFSAAMRSHDPEWKVVFGWRDLFRVIGIEVTLLVTLWVYTRLQPP